MKIELSLENHDILATWLSVGKHTCGNALCYCPQQDLDVRLYSQCHLTKQQSTTGTFEMSPGPACRLYKALSQLDEIYANFEENPVNPVNPVQNESVPQ